MISFLTNEKSTKIPLSNTTHPPIQKNKKQKTSLTDKRPPPKKSKRPMGHITYLKNNSSLSHIILKFVNIKLFKTVVIY